MWQIEDIIRAYSLDIEKINASIISKYEVSDDIKSEIINWYESLIEMMRMENVVSGEHLQLCKNVLIQLSEFHSKLLKSVNFPEYTAEFYKTLPFIVELRAKAGDNKAGELETCFNALYGMLLLRIQGKEISVDTEIAMKQISKFIATLAFLYKKNESKSIFEEDK